MNKWFGIFLLIFFIVYTVYENPQWFGLENTPSLRRIVCATETGNIASKWTDFIIIYREGGGEAYDKKGYHFMIRDKDASCEMEVS